jgi:hypothetical protein
MSSTSFRFIPDRLEKPRELFLDVHYFNQLFIQRLDKHFLDDNRGSFHTSSEAIRNSPPYRQHPKNFDISPV